MSDISGEPDAIADCVLRAFDALAPHRKPREASSGLKAGRREWVPLAGIVVDSGSDEPPAKRLKCAALATGMKCLPQDKITGLQGNVIHDSHAEILALRAFNRFLLDQCADLAARGNSETHNTAQDVVEWRVVSSEKSSANDISPASLDEKVTANKSPIRVSNDSTMDTACFWQKQPFQIKPTIKLHMYCSEAPCGDASMELTMAAQEDATPWSRTATPCSANSTENGGVSIASAPAEELLYGRSYFDVLGVVRRKPSRPDAPPTLSKSCSDKIALKQCTSILSSTTSMLVHPANAYIHTLTMPSSQYVEIACQRAFGPQGRMAPLLHHQDASLLAAGYHYRPFEVKTTTREFIFSRRIPAPLEAVSFVPSNVASLAYGPSQETLINGVLQGRKQADPRGASAISRRKMWTLALNIASLVGERVLIQSLSRPTYKDMKSCHPLRAREIIKRVTRQGPLKGWKTNSGDDHWSL